MNTINRPLKSFLQSFKTMNIRNRLWLSNLFLIAITVILLIIFSLIITANFQKFIGFPFKPEPKSSHRNPLPRPLYGADPIIKKIVTNPENLLDRDYLKQIDDFLNASNTGLIVQKEREIIYYSHFIASLGINRERVPYLEEDIEQYPKTINKLDENIFMRTIPFRFTDQSKGTLFLVNDSTSLSKDLTQFRNSVIYTLIAFLIIIILINTLITYLLSKKIVAPLNRLNNATQKIKAGNYNFSLPPESKDEIGTLFQSFEAARKQLKASEETKKRYEENRNELISNISHDLRTPITTIKGYVEGIIDGVPKSKEKLDKYLSTIHQNAQHMESLIEDLFLLSKFELNQSLYHFESINIKSYLNDSFEELRFELSEKGIHLELITNSPDDVRIKGDREQLRRVILNIIYNAVNYKSDKNPQIKMILTEGKDIVQIEIQDNGKGIAKYQLINVFERFYKADKARSAGASVGTGLGLYIAKKIITDHGGQTWARSQLGQGTSIFFTLPKIIVKTNLQKEIEKHG